MFYKNFKDITNNTDLLSNRDFITAKIGTRYDRRDGVTYEKTDAIVFDMVPKKILDSKDSDNRYARLEDNENKWDSTNIFNNKTYFNDVIHSQTIENGENIVTKNLTSTGEMIVTKFTLLKEGTATFLGDIKAGAATFDSVGTQTLNAEGLITTNGGIVSNGQISGVGIKSTSTLTANGPTELLNTLTVKGNTTLKSKLNVDGDSTFSNIKVTGQATINEEICDLIRPSASGKGTVGTSGYRYATAYINEIYGTAQQARYADLAECYTTDKEYEPGTVLEISDKDGEMRKFNGGTFGGVVSTKPGMILNNELQNGVKVALKGLVPVFAISDIKRGQFCVAKDGKVYGVDKKDMTTERFLDLVGVAMENSKDGKVLVKM